MESRSERIERLKENRTPWGWLDEEDKKLLQSGEVPVDCLQSAKAEHWHNVVTARSDTYFNITYRIAPDYHEPAPKLEVGELYVCHCAETGVVRIMRYKTMSDGGYYLGAEMGRGDEDLTTFRPSNWTITRIVTEEAKGAEE